MAAPVTHFEVNARDGKRAQEFYSNLFGWTINVVEGGYGLVDTGVKMGINGGVGQTMEGGQPNVTFYIQVEDPQAYLDKAVGLGGRVVTPVTEIPNMVTFAQFADPEGNVIGIIKGSQSPPKEVRPRKKPAPRKKKVQKRKGGRKRK
ncbi:MAG: VOC family protein [Bacteroidota bacterium]|nr:VOC family protein [Bacteroidota bacterium]